MGILAILLIVFIAYVIYRVGNSFGARKVAEHVEEQVSEIVEKAPRFEPYADAARKIGSGALDAAKLATDNAKDVVADVQREKKLEKLQALLEDEELLAELKSRVKQ